jgi:hypothetical protein
MPERRTLASENYVASDLYNVPLLDGLGVKYKIYDNILNTPEVSACVWFAIAKGLGVPHIRSMSHIVENVDDKIVKDLSGLRMGRQTIKHKLHNLGDGRFPIYTHKLCPLVTKRFPQIAILVFDIIKNNRLDPTEPWQMKRRPVTCFFNNSETIRSVLFLVRSYDQLGSHLQLLKLKGSSEWQYPVEKVRHVLDALAARNQTCKALNVHVQRQKTT